MFTTVMQQIITALEGMKTDGTPVFRLVDVWQGDVDELMKSAQKLPSVHVIFSMAEYGESQTTRGSDLPPSETTWSLVLIAQNLRDRKSGAVESLVLIERLLQMHNPATPATGGLTGLKTSRGRLWPAVIQLLGQENGKAAYGIKFFNRKGY